MKMKRLLSLLLVFGLTFTLTGCGDKKIQSITMSANDKMLDELNKDNSDAEIKGMNASFGIDEESQKIKNLSMNMEVSYESLLNGEDKMSESDIEKMVSMMNYMYKSDEMKKEIKKISKGADLKVTMDMKKDSKTIKFNFKANKAFIEGSAKNAGEKESKEVKKLLNAKGEELVETIKKDIKKNDNDFNVTVKEY